MQGLVRQHCCKRGVHLIELAAFINGMVVFVVGRWFRSQM